MCDSSYDSDRSDLSSLSSAVLACRVVKVFLVFLISMDRFLILALLSLLDLDLLSSLYFFFFLFVKLEDGWPFCDNCSTLYISSRPCHMFEDYFHHWLAGRKSFLVIHYLLEWSDWCTGSKYSEYSAKSSGICHPQ